MALIKLLKGKMRAWKRECGRGIDGGGERIKMFSNDKIVHIDCSLSWIFLFWLTAVSWIRNCFVSCGERCLLCIWLDVYFCLLLEDGYHSWFWLDRAFLWDHLNHPILEMQFYPRNIWLFAPPLSVIYINICLCADLCASVTGWHLKKL